MKPVFQTSAILRPNLERDHYEVAADTIKSLREEHPEFECLWLSASLKELPNGNAILSISVLDPNKVSWREVFRPFLRPAFWISVLLYGIWFLYFKE